MAYDITLLLDGLILVFLCVTIFYAARLSLFMKSFRQGKSDMHRLVRDLNNVIARAESAVIGMKENAADVEAGMKEVIHEAKFLSDELKFMNETGDGLADRLEKLADRNRELVDLMENPSEPASAREYVRTYDLDEVEGGESSDLERTFNIQDFDLDAVELDEDDEFDFLALSDGAYREEDALDGVDHYAESYADGRSENYPPENNMPENNLSASNAPLSKMRHFSIFDRDYIDDLKEESDDEEAANNQDFHSRAEQELFEALQSKKRAHDDYNDDYYEEEGAYHDEDDAETDTHHSRRVSKFS